MDIAWKVVTELEPGYAVLAYHTTPKCIVQIGRQCFPAGHNERTQRSRDKRGNCDLPLCTPRLPRHEIEHCICMSPSLQRGPSGKIQHTDAAITRGDFINLLV